MATLVTAPPVPLLHAEFAAALSELVRITRTRCAKGIDLIAEALEFTIGQIVKPAIEPYQPRFVRFVARLLPGSDLSDASKASYRATVDRAVDVCKGWPAVQIESMVFGGVSGYVVTLDTTSEAWTSAEPSVERGAMLLLLVLSNFYNYQYVESSTK